MKRSLPNRSDSVGTSVSRFLFSRAQAALAPCIALMLPWQLSRVELLRGPWAQPASQMPKSPMANSLIRVFTIVFSLLCSVCVHPQVTTPVRFGSCRRTLRVSDRRRQRWWSARGASNGCPQRSGEAGRRFVSTELVQRRVGHRRRELNQRIGVNTTT